MRCLAFLTVVALWASTSAIGRADDCVTIRYVEMLESQHYDALIGFCNDQLLSSPNDTLAHFFRGIAHRRTKDFEAAMKDFQSVVRLNPKSAAACNVIGLTILERHGFFDIKPMDKDEAISDFTKAIDLDPG